MRKNGIIIDEKHLQEIMKEVTRANGQAQLRKVSAKDIFDAVERIKESTELSAYQLDGSKFHVDLHAQIKASSYDYPMYSTSFDLLFKNGKAYLARVRRGYVLESRQNVRAELSDGTKERLLRRYAIFAI